MHGPQQRVVHVGLFEQKHRHTELRIRPPADFDEERARTLLDAYFGHHAEIVAPVLVIDGNRLMKALGLKPGPVIRELLDLIREGQVTGTVTDEESALAAARNYLSGTS